MPTPGILQEAQLKETFSGSTTYAKAEDWIFASVRKKGASPRVGNMLVWDYLYPAAIQAGALTESRMHTTWVDRKTGKTVAGEKTLYF
jgi:hypothetical protein